MFRIFGDERIEHGADEKERNGPGDPGSNKDEEAARRMGDRVANRNVRCHCQAYDRKLADQRNERRNEAKEHPWAWLRHLRWVSIGHYRIDDDPRKYEKGQSNSADQLAITRKHDPRFVPRPRNRQFGHSMPL